MSEGPAPMNGATPDWVISAKEASMMQQDLE